MPDSDKQMFLFLVEKLAALFGAFYDTTSLYVLPHVGSVLTILISIQISPKCEKSFTLSSACSAFPCLN
jgi:hypothetical protein